jgi:hypothetical protein
MAPSQSSPSAKVRDEVERETYRSRPATRQSTVSFVSQSIIKTTICNEAGPHDAVGDWLLSLAGKRK